MKWWEQKQNILYLATKSCDVIPEHRHRTVTCFSFGRHKIYLRIFCLLKQMKWFWTQIRISQTDHLPLYLHAVTQTNDEICLALLCLFQPWDLAHFGPLSPEITSHTIKSPQPPRVWSGAPSGAPALRAVGLESPHGYQTRTQPASCKWKPGCVKCGRATWSSLSRGTLWWAFLFIKNSINKD